MNKQVLIIAPSFPPQVHTAVYRTYRLAKYLPEFGWKPYILTVDTNYSNREDYWLLERLPDDVEIATARYIEPSLRGLRMALGGMDRTEAALHASDPGAVTSGVPRTRDGSVKESVRRVYSHVLHRWGHTPDDAWTWYWPALRAARRLIDQYDIPLVYTTAPRWTGHRIGAALQQDGARWVADFRDPPTYMHHLHSNRPAAFAKQRSIEAAAVTCADAVTVASYGIGMILTDMHGPGSMKRWEFIPTGIDTDMVSQCEVGETEAGPYLVFPGRVSPEYGTEFLKVFSAALAIEGVKETGIRLLIVGDVTLNRPVVQPIVERLGIEDHVLLLEYMPQPNVIALLGGALAGVLLTGRTARWWCLHAKAVEYMGLRKRVVALLPELSESRLHLEKTGLGVFLDGDLEQSARTLSDFVLGRLPLAEVNDAECGRFTATRQAESFAALFERIVVN